MLDRTKLDAALAQARTAAAMLADALADAEAQDAVVETKPTATRNLGVSVSLGDWWSLSAAAIGARCDEITGLGAQWLRMDVNWSWIEPVKGNPDWSRIDTIVNAAVGRRLNVLLVVGTMPAWNRPAGTTEVYGPTTAGQVAAFAAYFRQVVARYKDRVRHYEVWNEANHPPFWTAPNAANYAALTKAVYAQAKAEDPAVTIVSAGTAWTGTGGIETVSWYRQILAAGARFDVANLHTYQDPAQAAAGNYNTGELAKIAKVRALLPAGMPLWSTESGFPTSGASSVTELVQRDGILAGMRLFAAAEPAGVMFIYSLRDRKPIGATTDREAYFGLIRQTGEHKPAYAAIKATT